MKERYFPELGEMYQKIAVKLQQHDSLPQQPNNDQFEKLKLFKAMLERLTAFLTASKSSITPAVRDKLGSYEKQITSFLNSNRPPRPVSSLQQGQQLPLHQQQNVMDLQEQLFHSQRPIPEASSNCHGSGWQAVPVHDPVVQDAANHAVKTIQQRSNSLFPYELREIVHAKAEVIEESAKFDMLLKVNKGDKEEKFKVEVHKNHEGAFHLNQMEPDHS